jgi:hypothetical protein
MSRKGALLGGAAVVLLAASVAWAQRGVLFADMFPPTKGTYDAPAGELGKKPAQPWSQTTVAAAVQGKPLTGQPMTIVGEIIDYSCYFQVGKHGDKHRDCGQKCLRNGQPIGLLAKDGTIYLLMEEEHDPRRDRLTDFRTAAIEHMAHIMTVNGTYSNVEGQRALYVTGFVTEK